MRLFCMNLDINNTPPPALNGAEIDTSSLERYQSLKEVINQAFQAYHFYFLGGMINASKDFSFQEKAAFLERFQASMTEIETLINEDIAIQFQEMLEAFKEASITLNEKDRETRHRSMKAHLIQYHRETYQQCLSTLQHQFIENIITIYRDDDASIRDIIHVYNEASNAEKSKMRKACRVQLDKKSLSTKEVSVTKAMPGAAPVLSPIELPISQQKQVTILFLEEVETLVQHFEGRLKNNVVKDYLLSFKKAFLKGDPQTRRDIFQQSKDFLEKLTDCPDYKAPEREASASAIAPAEYILESIISRLLTHSHSPTFLGSSLKKNSLGIAKAEKIKACLKTLPLKARVHIGDEGYDGDGCEKLYKLHEIIATHRDGKKPERHRDGTIKRDTAARSFNELMKQIEKTKTAYKEIKETCRLQLSF